jgi:formamidopyrimidine-DNA glycosylase
MPEICEVVLTSQALKDKLLNKKLNKINILSGRYTKTVFKGYNKMVFPLKVTNIDSHGKFMWFQFENDKYLLNTFGLTGMWGFNKTKYNRIEFVFEDNIIAYYDDDRNFGTFEYDDTADAFNKKINKLAPDLLKTNFTKEQFLEWFKDFLSKSSKRKDMLIVKVLMNQNKSDGIGSGLGNYLVPEILYRCKISPHRKMGNLTDNEIMNMSQIIKQVLKQCYIYNDTGYMEDIKDFVEEHYNGIHKGKYPDYHLEIKIPKGQKFMFYVYRQKVDPYGNKVIAEKILGNRSTYWVPNIQN